MDDMKVQLLLEAIDKMSGPLKGIQGELDKLTTAEQKSAAAAKKISIAHGEAMQKVGKGAMVAGAAMTAAIGGTLVAAAQLQDAQAEAMNAFGTDTGMDKFWPEINKQAIEAGNLYPGTTADFLQLGASMKKAGADAEMMASGGFKGAAALQVMFKLNPAEGGRMFQEMANGMTVAGKDAMAFADVIQRTSFASGLSLAGMHDALTYTSAPLKALKVEGLEASKSVMAMMGVLKQGGLQDSQVGTALQAAFTHISMLGAKLKHGRGFMTKDAETALSAKGIKLDFFDKAGEFKGLSNFIQQLDKLKGLGTQERLNVMKALFGDEGMKAAILLTTDKVNEMTEKMVHQEAIQKRLDRITQALGNKWESVKGSAVNALAAIGTTLTPYLVPVLDKLNGILGAITDLADAHPGLTAAIAGTVGILGALLLVGGGTFFIVGKMITVFWEAKAAIETLGIAAKLASFKTAALSLSMWPLWLAAVAVAGVAYLMYKHWDTVAPIFEGAADSADHLSSELGALFTLADTGSGDINELNDSIGAGKIIATDFALALAFVVYGLRAIVNVARLAIIQIDQMFSVMGAMYDGFQNAGGPSNPMAVFMGMKAGAIKNAELNYKNWDLGNVNSKAGKIVDSMLETSPLGNQFTGDDMFHTQAKAAKAKAEVDKAMHTRLNEARVAKAVEKAQMAARGGFSIQQLVGQIQITSMDEPTFTAQFMDAVKKKAPELYRQLERQMKVQGRGSFTPATQGAY